MVTRDMPGVTVTLLPALLHNRPRRHPGGGSRPHPPRAPQLRPHLRGLRRLRHRRPARRGAGAGGRRAFAGRPLLRALQRTRGLCADDRRGTGHLLPDRLPGPRLRTAGHRRAGLDRHPELLPLYFGNYRRLVYLAQTDDPALLALASRAAARLGLAFEHRFTGHVELAASLAAASLAAATGEGLAWTAR